MLAMMSPRRALGALNLNTTPTSGTSAPSAKKSPRFFKSSSKMSASKPKLATTPMSVEAVGTRGIFQTKPGPAPAEVEVFGIKGVFGSVRGPAPSKAAAVAHTASMDAADAAGLPKGLRDHWRADAQGMQAKAAQHAEVHIHGMSEQLELADMYTSNGMGPYANGAYKAAARSAVDGANVMARCAAELVSSGVYANECVSARLASRWRDFDGQQRKLIEQQHEVSKEARSWLGALTPALRSLKAPAHYWQSCCAARQSSRSTCRKIAS